MMIAAVAFENLPTVNACLNSLAALCLLAGFAAIRRGRPGVHRALMISAFCVSAAFLTSYLIYHFSNPRTVFRDPAWFRPIYLAILLTHTVLAMVILPLIFMTFWRAFKGRWEAHKRLARWTLPLWLYVSVTGVLIYYLLYIKFPQTPAAPVAAVHERLMEKPGAPQFPGVLGRGISADGSCSTVQAWKPCRGLFPSGARQGLPG